jgi:hypothetical protein
LLPTVGTRRMSLENQLRIGLKTSRAFSDIFEA